MSKEDTESASASAEASAAHDCYSVHPGKASYCLFVDGTFYMLRFPEFLAVVGSSGELSEQQNDYHTYIAQWSENFAALTSVLNRWRSALHRDFRALSLNIVVGTSKKNNSARVLHFDQAVSRLVSAARSTGLRRDIDIVNSRFKFLNTFLRGVRRSLSRVGFDEVLTAAYFNNVKRREHFLKFCARFLSEDVSLIGVDCRPLFVDARVHMIPKRYALVEETFDLMGVDCELSSKKSLERLLQNEIVNAFIFDGPMISGEVDPFNRLPAWTRLAMVESFLRIGEREALTLLVKASVPMGLMACVCLLNDREVEFSSVRGCGADIDSDEWRTKLPLHFSDKARDLFCTWLKLARRLKHSLSQEGREFDYQDYSGRYGQLYAHLEEVGFPRSMYTWNELYAQFIKPFV